MTTIAGTQTATAQTESVPLSEAHRRQAEDRQQQFDRADLLHRLSGKLENLHEQGQELHAACPQCGGEDRFFTAAGTDHRYTHWFCRQCGHKASTRALLGHSGWSVAPRPAVSEWSGDTQIADITLEINQDLYLSLAATAHNTLLNTPHALQYLYGRGVTDDVIQNALLGFIDADSYRQWHDGLNYAQRAALERAGLPECKSDQPLRGHGAMFAAGHRGKIVLPYLDQSGNIADIRTRSISDRDTIRNKSIRYTSPKLAYNKRGATIPYGADRLGNAQRVIVTEGEFKSLAPISQELDLPVLGLRGASDWQPEYLDLLRNRQVILAFDNDLPDGKDRLSAGQRATINIGRKLRVNDIDVMVLDPAHLGDQKGIDDFINTYGIEAFTGLLQPQNLLTLPEFERKLADGGGNLSGLTMPKSDPGTKRQWRPREHVDQVYHTEYGAVTVEQASDELRATFNDYWQNWHWGETRPFCSAPPGVGKTTIALETAREYQANMGGTMAVFLPSHSTIDEKIADGTLEDFRHIYGRRSDDEIHNCTQAETAQFLTKKGYSPGGLLCPLCPDRGWCSHDGYMSQFQHHENRAYTHGHLFSNYAENEDMVVIDELGHGVFIQEMNVYLGDLTAALEKAHLSNGAREMMAALVDLLSCKDAGLGTIGGHEFYSVLQRYCDNFYDVDAWGDGLAVQMALDAVAKGFASQDRSQRSVYEAEQLPDQFGELLFSVMSDDVREMIAGRKPSGRLRMVTGCGASGPYRYLQLTTSKGRLPRWFNKSPVISLNATASPELMEELLEDINVIAPQVAVRDGNEVIQDITRNNAKSGLMGDSDQAQKRRAKWISQIRSHITDEADTTIIAAKAVIPAIQQAFPQARVGWYGGLEGRNDLQSSTTILATPPPVNVEAVKREASALWPGCDTTITRAGVAFDIADAAGNLLTVEQISAADPRVQMLLEQHRDAKVVQAVHRSRVVRQTGRKVVALFARPIPGLKPTQIITERPTVVTKQAKQRQATLEKLAGTAADLATAEGGFTVSMLAKRAGCDPKTVRKYWEEIANSEHDLNRLDVPCLQPLARGGQKPLTVKMALTSSIVDAGKLAEASGQYPKLFLALETSITKLLPETWQIDYNSLNLAPSENDEMYDRDGRYSNTVITSVPVVHLVSGAPDSPFEPEPEIVSYAPDWVANAPPIPLDKLDAYQPPTDGLYETEPDEIAMLGEGMATTWPILAPMMMEPSAERVLAHTELQS